MPIPTCALPEFKVVYGRGFEASGPNLWEDAQPHDGSHGRYDTTITSSFSLSFLPEWKADRGYRPAVQRMDEAKNSVTLPFRLAKAAGNLVTILRPDRPSAEGAAAYVLSPKQNLLMQQTAMFMNRRLAGVNGYTVLKPDAAGKISIPESQPARSRVVVLDDSGYADVSTEEALASHVALSPWARVEGVAYIGKIPLANQTVSLNTRAQYGSRQSPQFVSGEFLTQTDNDGNFVFERVPSVKASVGRYIEPNGNTQWGEGLTTNDTKIDLTPGGTTKAVIGGSGRAVIGHVATSDGSALPATWIYSFCRLDSVWVPTTMPVPVPPPELQQQVKNMTPDERQNFMAEYEKRPEVAAYLKAQSDAVARTAALRIHGGKGWNISNR